MKNCERYCENLMKSKGEKVISSSLSILHPRSGELFREKKIIIKMEEMIDKKKSRDYDVSIFIKKR